MLELAHNLDLLENVGTLLIESEKKGIAVNIYRFSSIKRNEGSVVNQGREGYKKSKICVKKVVDGNIDADLSDARLLFHVAMEMLILETQVD
jgi:hypothetical protein